MSPETFWQVEERRLEVCKSEMSSSMNKKWQRCFQHLHQIIDVCKRQKTEIRFVIIPDEFQVNKTVLQEATKRANLTIADIDLELPQKKLSQFFTEQRVHHLDLLPVFRKHDQTYAPFDTHWNKQGNLLAATEIHKWLTSEED